MRVFLYLYPNLFCKVVVYRKKSFYDMIDLTTSFAGLTLKNPIIVSSSSLTDSPTKCQTLEENGAGAIVLKSIFEEQIMQQYDQWNDRGNADSNDYLETYLRSHSLNEYTYLIQRTKKLCTIPVIASINCSTDSEWATYAKMVEQAGADALEINIMEVQTDTEYTYGSYEQKHINILKRIKRNTRLPVIMKLGQNLTNPVSLINQLYANGADAIVLFNRPYRPDINIDTRSFHAGEIWSRPGDICESLRWIGISSAKVPYLNYAISGGVHDGWGIVKALLAGASAAEICTTLFWNGSHRIQVMKTQLEEWMQKAGYEQLSQFIGEMNMNSCHKENYYGRTQFMQYFSSYKENEEIHQ